LTIIQKGVIKVLLFFTLFHGSIFAQDVNIDLLTSQAKLTDKHLLILLGQTGCSYCKKMKKFVLNDKNVKPYLKNDFLFEYIDIKKKGIVTFKEFKGSKREFAKHIKQRFYPSSIFIDSENNIVYSQAGVIRKEKFLLTLEFIKNRAYKNMSFQDYVDEKEFEEEL